MAISCIVKVAAILIICHTLDTIPVNDAKTDLKFYNPQNSNDLMKLKQWANMVYNVKNQMTNEKVAFQLLATESCKSKTSPRCAFFNEARNLNKFSPGLMSAESVAVTMYTTKFFTEFNTASDNGVWEPYKVYTYLLYCALHKLSLNKMYRVQSTCILYRNLKSKHKKPNVPRIFWKTFTSTSIYKSIPDKYGYGTRIIFHPQASKYGARIDHLSKYPEEGEVLLPPFEAFDVLPPNIYDESQINFKRSKAQELYYLKNICK